MRPIAALTVLLAALAVVSGAAAVGPSLPGVDGGTGISAGSVSYVARLAGGSTRLVARSHGAALRSATIPGSWGVQLATLDGGLTGLSTDGRTLVLTDNLGAPGTLRAVSRFAVVDTRTLTLTRKISLRGDFTVDALSPDAGTLYLIQHVSRADLTKYQVRAYDLRTNRLAPGAIADKTQAGWVMAGYPLTRVATADGRWVYTLYRQDGNYPFVHALDTVTRTAVCVGLPVDWTTEKSWLTTAQLTLGDGTLEIRANGGAVRLVLDTRTFRLSTP